MKHRAGKLCRTLAVFLLSMLVLSLLVFVIARLAPGDPLVSYYGERAEKMKPAERAQAEARLGLDQPIAQQYLIWLKGALRGEFGISYKYKMDVLAVIPRKTSVHAAAGRHRLSADVFPVSGTGSPVRAA